jgi:hypothetical protein
MSLLVLRRRIAGLLLLSSLLAACGGHGSGPVLIAESTYVVPTVAVLPSITPTHTPSPTDLPTLLPFTPDTPAAEVILITPTLAPSRMPTQTYTPSNTPTLTYTPSPTRRPTQDSVPHPTPFVPAFVPTQARLAGRSRRRQRRDRAAQPGWELRLWLVRDARAAVRLSGNRAPKQRGGFPGLRARDDVLVRGGWHDHRAVR